jgi:hypothetical protein
MDTQTKRLGARGVKETPPEVLAQRYAKEKTIKVMATARLNVGAFTEDFHAIQRRDEIGEGEIVELPLSLWERMQRDGIASAFTTDAATMREFENKQRGFQNRNRIWFEGYEARRVRALNKIQEGQIEAEAKRLLAVEQAEHLAKLRKIARKNLGL